MIENLLQGNFPDVELVHVRVGFVSHIKDHGKINLRKILHVFSLIGRIIYHRFADNPKIFYYLPAGPDRLTLLRDYPILISTRWLFEKTVFHFQLAGISNLYDELPFWQRWLFRRAYFGADAAIRLSELNPEDGKRLAAKREYVIPNAIEDPCPEFAAAGTRHAVRASDPMRILFVAMLRESKGLLVLIDACAKLAAEGVPFHLEIMGQWSSDDFAARVHERIQELNLGAQLSFLGVMVGDEKYAAFRRADVFCFPTFFSNESFGVVLVEAMAFGLPTVSTRWRGIPSVIDDGKTGFIVDPHDPAAVADRLSRLAADGELRTQMGDAGRERFLQKFTLARHHELMRKMFLEVGGESNVYENIHVGEISASSV